MFAEFLDRLTAVAKAGMNQQSASERNVLAAVAQLAATQAENHAQQVKLLKQILAAVTLPPAVKGVLTFEMEGQTKEGEHITMKVPQNQQGTLTVTYQAAKPGVKGVTDGPPTWTAAPEGVVELTPSADGLSCGVKTLPVPEGQPVASVVITVDGDGDLGDGRVDIVSTASLTVYNPASGAVVGEITVGEFVDVPQQ